MPSSTSPEGPRYALSVTAADPMVEIFVVDHRFALAARGLGSVSTRLPQGIYKIRAKAGRSNWEELVVLDKPLSVTVPVISFGSASPLADTTRTHESHISAAHDISSRPTRSLGKGASIFVMARMWTGPGPVATRKVAFSDPATGLSLRRPSGRLVGDLSRFAVRGDEATDRWAACTVEVDPGLYLLRMKHQDGYAEQTITALPDWQTQIFLLYEPPRDRSEDGQAKQNRLLADLSMLLMRGSFHHDDRMMRLADAARFALADERSVISDELSSIASGKFENPMLGLFAAHLLLVLRDKEERDMAGRVGDTRPEPARPARFDQDFFEEVLRNTAKLFGADHPDVRALALASTRERTTRPVRIAPMLWRGWQMLIAGSNEDPRLIPLSLWARVGNSTGQRPFLMWLHGTRSFDEQFREAARITNSVLGGALSLSPEVRSEALRLMALQGGDLVEGAPASVDATPSGGVEDFKRRMSRELGLPRSVIDLALSAR
jgi:hypothetical protein